MVRPNCQLILVAGLALAACTDPTDTELPPAADIVAAATLEAAHPAITQSADMGNPNRALVTDPSNGIRRVVISADCPTISAVTCGGEVARAAGLWLANNGSTWGEHQSDPVTELLVNIDLVEGGMGYQLRGTMPDREVLAGASRQETLEIFRFNGGSEAGKIAVADWCGADVGRETPAFCTAFFDQVCAGSLPEIVRACPEGSRPRS